MKTKYFYVLTCISFSNNVANNMTEIFATKIFSSIRQACAAGNAVRDQFTNDQYELAPDSTDERFAIKSIKEDYYNGIKLQKNDDRVEIVLKMLPCEGRMSDKDTVYMNMLYNTACHYANIYLYPTRKKFLKEVDDTIINFQHAGYIFSEKLQAGFKEYAATSDNGKLQIIAKEEKIWREV